LDNLESLAFNSAIGILLYVLGVESICNAAPVAVSEVCVRVCNPLALLALSICNPFQI